MPETGAAPPRLIVTRPAAQAQAWVTELHAMGLAAEALPLIDILPLADTRPLRSAWAELAEFALLVFVSPNAVLHFFALAPAGARWPAGVLAAATGPGTAAALRAAGVPDAAVVEPAADSPSHDSESLWLQLAGHDWAGRRVRVVRGEDGRDWLAEALKGRGAALDFMAAYRRQAPRLDAPAQQLLQRALEAPAAHLWLFSSSEAVLNLQALAPGADWSRSAAIASHPRIADGVRQAGFGRLVIAAPSVQAVAAAATAAARAAPAWVDDGPSIQSATL